MGERMELARERIFGLSDEITETLPGDWQDFFLKGISFAKLVTEIYESDDPAFYKEVNKKLYEDILPENYVHRVVYMYNIKIIFP